MCASRPRPAEPLNADWSIVVISVVVVRVRRRARRCRRRCRLRAPDGKVVDPHALLADLRLERRSWASAVSSRVSACSASCLLDGPSADERLGTLRLLTGEGHSAASAARCDRDCEGGLLLVAFELKDRPPRLHAGA